MLSHLNWMCVVDADLIVHVIYCWFLVGCSNFVGSLLDVCVKTFIDVNLRFEHGSIW